MIEEKINKISGEVHIKVYYFKRNILKENF